MKTHLVSFATPDFEWSLAELGRTARRFGIDEFRAWRPEQIKRTAFYRKHRRILAQRRGRGYWLWKPYIIRQALKDAAAGDIVVYADAGISVVRSLSPIFDLCLQHEGILLFRGAGVCRTWTKRDCFILAGCDSPRYYNAPMVDASFLVVANTAQSRRIIQDWLNGCMDPRALTDQKNTCGRRNLPGFLEHRHDQSVLSLVAARHDMELCRSPSQFGNHLKSFELRRAGEWVAQHYDEKAVLRNSPYPTLLFHHRKRRLLSETPEGGVASDSISSVVLAAASVLDRPVRLLQIGARCGLDVDRLPAAWTKTRLTSKERRIPLAWRKFDGSRFNVVVSDAAPWMVVSELAVIDRLRLLDQTQYVLVWTKMESMAGWAMFRSIRTALVRILGAGTVSFQFGYGIDGDRARSRQRTVGVLSVNERRRRR